MLKRGPVFLALVVLLVLLTGLDKAYPAEEPEMALHPGGAGSPVPVVPNWPQIAPTVLPFNKALPSPPANPLITPLRLPAEAVAPPQSAFFSRIGNEQLPARAAIPLRPADGYFSAGGSQSALAQPETTCTVNSTADSGSGSLRQCLLNVSPGDTIIFDPTLFPPNSPNVIFVSSPLPFITDNNLTIDASNAGVILFGLGLTGGSGLVVDGADGVTIRGLIIGNFPEDGIQLRNGASDGVIGGTIAGARNVLCANGIAGLYIADSGTNGNQVQGNYIGTDETGTIALANGSDGIEISFGASNNIIGGTTAAARNLISGNSQAGGVWIHESGTANNQVLGNYIGTDVTGLAALPNLWGVIVGYEAQNNQIGGTAVGAGNILSGNTLTGVQIQDSGTTGNVIQGNYVGLDATGANALANLWGVTLGWGTQNNTVGGTSAGARNVISGNTHVGVGLKDSGTTGNTIQGNYIGLDATGLNDVGNEWGVGLMTGAQNNIIGGTSAATRNVIGGNLYGVQLQDSGTTGNAVRGNYIGMDASGTNVLANTVGVAVALGAQNNLIGSAASGAGNVISGNQIGIEVLNPGTNGTQILGNMIGLNPGGTEPLGNIEQGIFVSEGAQGTIIGGSAAQARNIISGNQTGILIQNAGTANNQVLGNYIGTNISGTIAISNTYGILISYGTQNNIIGGTTAGEVNIISGNVYGVQLQDSGTTSNQVRGNLIGLDATGATSLGNYMGVHIVTAAQNNSIGGTTNGAGNILSGNDIGIVIDGGQEGDTNGNQILGNYIGPDATGQASLGNEFGIVIDGDAQLNVIGGNTAAARNIISGNATAGIQIQNDGAIGNQILGNYIGTDATGTQRLDNLIGVAIGFGAQNNVVGGDSVGEGNLISGNHDSGVIIQGSTTSDTTDNQILGNFIGTNVAGSGVLSNTVGVVISNNVQDSVIGGEAAGAGNIISGNAEFGIQIHSAANNQVMGNIIGLNAAGTAPLGNDIGIAIGSEASEAHDNVIGGVLTGAGNIISGNATIGVLLRDSNTSNNQVLGNYIGTDQTGMVAAGNEWGILIWLGATNNIIGGATAGARNIVSGNHGPGIEIQGDGVMNQVLGNYIGTNLTGMAPLGNEIGVLLTFGAQNNIVGGNTAAARNVISGNSDIEVAIQDVDTIGNQVAGNYIGLDSTGTEGMGSIWGVVISARAHDNLIGGGTAGSGNIISDHTTGIQLQDDGTGNNEVLSNYIGTDASGAIALGNSIGVVVGWQADNNMIGDQTAATSNVISGNDKGLWIGHLGTTGNQVLANKIGPDAAGGEGLGNQLAGVYLADRATDNTIGVSNTIAYNGADGVTITGTLTLKNSISRNAIYFNGGLPINYQDTPNPIPGSDLCYNSSPHVLSGTTCPNCLVELFANPDTTLAGTLFLTDGTANSGGNLTVAFTTPPQLFHLTVTVTDLEGTTSEFFPLISCPGTPQSLYLPLVIR